MKLKEIVNSIIPCEYRKNCLSKDNLTDWEKNYYGSCRKIHMKDCIKARQYQTLLAQDILIEDMGLVNRLEQLKNG